MPVSRCTRSTIRRQTRAPAPMTSTRPGCMNPSAARSARRIVSSSVQAATTSLDRQRGEVDAGGVVRGQPQRLGGDGGDRPGQPHQRGHPAQVDRRGGLVDRGVDVGGGGRHLGRRRRVAAQVPLGHPDAADVDRPGLVDVEGAADELGGPAAEVDHEVGAVDAVRLQAAGRATERQRGLLVPGDHLGGDAVRREGGADAVDELGGVAGVTGGRGRHEPDPLDLELLALRGVVARHRQGAGHGLGGDLAGAVDPVAEPDDLHPAHHVDQRRGPAVPGSTSATSRRIELVPQSIAPTRVMPRPRPSGPRRQSATSSASGTQDPAAHHCGSAASASSPSGLTPGPAASEWPTSTCRHLTRVGMPPAEMPSISGTEPSSARRRR